MVGVSISKFCILLPSAVPVRGRILVMDSSGPITIGRSAPPTQTGIATVLRLQPPGDSRGVRWARAESCSISGELMPVKNGSLGPNTVVNSKKKKKSWCLGHSPDGGPWDRSKATALPACASPSPFTFTAAPPGRKTPSRHRCSPVVELVILCPTLGLGAK